MKANLFQELDLTSWQKELNLMKVWKNLIKM
jgi:hypothetical protein